MLYWVEEASWLTSVVAVGVVVLVVAQRDHRGGRNHPPRPNVCYVLVNQSTSPPLLALREIRQLPRNGTQHLHKGSSSSSLVMQ